MGKGECGDFQGVVFLDPMGVADADEEMASQRYRYMVLIGGDRRLPFEGGLERQ
jgi:hypothetical protein